MRFLLDATVTDGTARRYRSAVLRFTRWASLLGEEAETTAELDDLLVEYFHELFLSDAGRSPASNALNGLVWLCPDLRFQLPLAAAAVRGWEKLAVKRSYPPLTWELALAIATRLIVDGDRRGGVAIVLGFDCMLRPGELVALRREDVLDEGDARVGSEHRGMHLRLRRTKTGPNKSVEVLEPVVIEQLRALVRDTAPGECLFPFNTAGFRRRVHGACSLLGLSAAYVPHSLRHGGATRYSHVKRWPVEDVMVRGRWASTKSARGYIQSLRAVQMAVDVPPAVASAGAVLASDPCAAFRAAFVFAAARASPPRISARA